MVAHRRTPVSRLINRLLDLPPCEGGVATREHFRVLGDTVEADAFAVLRIRPGEESARILSGSGLRTPVGKGVTQLEAPFLIEYTIHSPDAPAVASEGPFGDDPFIRAEGFRSLVMKVFASGEIYRVTAAFRREDRPFSRRETENFAAVSGVMELLCGPGPSGDHPDTQRSRDDLTGLGLFTEFHDTLVKELSRARRGGGTVTMGIMSVLAEGSVPAEEMLLDITRALQDQLRNFDTLVRYGSAELAFILPDLRSAEGMRVMERVMREVVAAVGGAGKAPEIYIGLSCYPEDSATVERLIEMAEASMNRAIEESRPGVYRWEEENSKK